MQQQDVAKCHECGGEFIQGKPICARCGTVKRGTSYKSRTTASVLAILLGSFGAHRFFLGQWWGLFYLLLFWTGIPMLVGLIEGIVFLASSQKSWNAKYNGGLNLGEESGLVVAIFAVIMPFGGFMLLGIIAAIALPAYQDYTMRAKSEQAAMEVMSIKTAMEMYRADKGVWPGGLDGLSGLVDIPAERRDLISLDSAGGIRVLIPEMGELYYSLGDDGWSCQGTTLKERHLPKICR